MILRGFKMRSLQKIVIFSFVLLLQSCGAPVADVGENDCAKDSVNSSVQSSSVAVSVASGTTSATSGADGSVNDPQSSSSSGMNDLPNFEAPMQDEISTRLHGCHKLSYIQLGNFLKSRGVAVPMGNVSDVRTTQISVFGSSQTLGSIFGGSGSSCEMAVTVANGTNDPVCSGGEVCFCNQDDKMNQVNRSCLDVGNNSPDAADGYCVAKPATAGFLYFSGKDALGVPKLDSRLGEKEEHSTASAMKLMDIFVQAAPQIIANIGDPLKAPACTLNGKNKPMFASDGSCVEESVSCLLGIPATEDHMLLCNLLLDKANKNDATDVMKKRNIVVAALLSAAHSCQ